MGICQDKSTTYLKRLGYNVVKHPRSGIRPMLLVGQQNGGTQILGHLRDLVTGEAPQEPELTEGQTATDVQGQASDSLSLGLGLSILSGFLTALGGNLGIKAEYRKASKLSFQFDDVKTDFVYPLAAGNYVRNADVDFDNPVVEEFVLGNGDLYLITRTVKARKFSVSTEDESGAKVELEVPIIKDAVGGEVQVEASGDRASTITYEGPEYLTFGFQAYSIGVRNGDLRLFIAEAGQIAVESVAPGMTRVYGEPVVFSSGLLDVQ